MPFQPVNKLCDRRTVLYKNFFHIGKFCGVFHRLFQLRGENILFIQKEALCEETEKYLQKNRIAVRPYEAVMDFLEKEAGRVSAALFPAISSGSTRSASQDIGGRSFQTVLRCAPMRRSWIFWKKRRAERRKLCWIKGIAATVFTKRQQGVPKWWKGKIPRS